MILHFIRNVSCALKKSEVKGLGIETCLTFFWYFILIVYNFNPFMVDTFTSFFNCPLVVRGSYTMMTLT